MKLYGLLLAVSLTGSILSGPAAETPKLPAGYKLLYEQNFEKPDAIKDFVFTDPKAWRIATEGDNHSLELFQQSKYEPANRSPFNIALLADRTFGDFVLEVDLLSTKDPYPHQDMCVFFNFMEPQKFYYTHIAVRPDPIKAESHAHDIFIVNDTPRLAIAKEISNGVTWGVNVWHKIRVERTLADGKIKVYFDDLAKPIMWAEDKRFGQGCVGFGSFDDVGKIDNIRIWGPSMEKKKTEFFQKAP